MSTQTAVSGGRTSNIRWRFSGLFFILGVISYMDRANLAIVAEPMMHDLGMNKIQFGLLISFFSLGYALAQIPAGMCAERYGARNILTIALTLWSGFTILTAVASNYIWLCIVRFLFGVGEAPIFPANGVFNAYWFGKAEKARAASFLLAGTYFGPVLAPLLSVLILVYFSWHVVFYVFGGIGLVIAVIWHLTSSNKPEEHKSISAGELAFIIKERTIDADPSARAPWRAFIARYDFWLVGIQYFFVAYMTVLFLAWLPTFLQEARGFSITHMGFAASIPWLAICFTVMVGGAISDRLLAKGYSRLVARGGPAIFGLVLFIVGILAAVNSTDQLVTVFWLSLALGALGLPVMASFAVSADKGRQFAGSVSGWMNLWGNLGGVVSPLLCGILAQFFGWNFALLFNIVPILIAIACWFFMHPDRPLTVSEGINLNEPGRN